jgi:hypothetical protein
MSDFLLGRQEKTLATGRQKNITAVGHVLRNRPEGGLPVTDISHLQ